MNTTETIKIVHVQTIHKLNNIANIAGSMLIKNKE